MHNVKGVIYFLGILLFSQLALADDVHAKLTKAIKCELDPLDSIRSIVAKGSNFKNGYSATSYGDGSANTAVVILDTPVEIAGAKSNAFFGSADSYLYFDFSGIVYGIFKGDYQKAVNELHLTNTKGEKLPIGKFQRKIRTRWSQDDLCPLTIGLTPLKNGEFVLGCGWCNG